VEEKLVSSSRWLALVNGAVDRCRARNPGLTLAGAQGDARR
jgi:hypothetical protein